MPGETKNSLKLILKIRSSQPSSASRDSVAMEISSQACRKLLRKMCATAVSGTVGKCGRYSFSVLLSAYMIIGKKRIDTSIRCSGP